VLLKFPSPILTGKLGTLNVVEPSPTPKRVPTALNSAEYVLRLTADPSQSKYPDGTVGKVFTMVWPVGTVLDVTAASSVEVIDILSLR
jgi:hypothetical protein